MIGLLAMGGAREKNHPGEYKGRFVNNVTMSSYSSTLHSCYLRNTSTLRSAEVSKA